MTPLREVPARNYLQAFLIYLVLMTLAFSTRWVSHKKILFEELWDPIPVQFLYPRDQLESDALRHGKIALWDPYAGFGSTIAVPSSLTLANPLKLASYLMGNDNAEEFIMLLRLVLAGFFAYMLARSISLSHPSGMLAGMGYMFCGYFREFSNFMDLYASMSYPLALIFLIRFFREFRFFDFVFAILAAYLVITGGHSEAIYYIYALAFVVAAFMFVERSLSGAEKPLPALLRRLFFFALISFGLHVFSYLTFHMFEMAKLGWLYHPRGLGQAHFDINHMIALATPIFDFWFKLPEKLPGNLAQFTVIPAYLGFVFCSLALLAVCNIHKSDPVIGLFLLLAMAMLGLFFGLPGFSWFTSLPVIKEFQNFRYPQPILALAIAVLAGFGFDRLDDGKNRLIYFAIVCSLCAWVIFHIVVFWNFLFRNPLLAAGALLILVFSAGLVVYYFLKRKSPAVGTSVRAIIFAAAAAELFCYFVFAAPLFGAAASRPQKPAFLAMAKIDPEFYRFYSPDQNILPPNTASLFGLRDIRQKSPVYPADYFRFFSAVNGWKDEEEALEDFLADGKFYLPLRLDRVPENVQNLLFGYLALDHRAESEDLASEFDTGSLLAPAPNYFSKNQFELDGKTRAGFLIHPPSRLVSGGELPAGEVAFEIGFLVPAQPQSDGADFLVFGNSRGQTHLAFARFLPRAESKQRGWIGYQMNLGSEQKLELATLPGPRGQATQDFAVFAGLSAPGKNRLSQYQLVSDAGPFLYRRRFAVPRFFLAKNIDWVASKEKALDLVRQHKFGPDEVNIVSRELEPNVNAAGATGKINLMRDESDLVALRLDLNSPGFLVMTDTYYPGWEAFVDGKRVKIFRADYLFRAVQVPAGAHDLKFRYRPVSFEIGLWQNLAFFFAAIVWMLLLVLRKRLAPGLYPARRVRD